MGTGGRMVRGPATQGHNLLPVDTFKTFWVLIFSKHIQWWAGEQQRTPGSIK